MSTCADFRLRTLPYDGLGLSDPTSNFIPALKRLISKNSFEIRGIKCLTGRDHSIEFFAVLTSVSNLQRAAMGCSLGLRPMVESRFSRSVYAGRGTQLKKT